MHTMTRFASRFSVAVLSYLACGGLVCALGSCQPGQRLAPDDDTQTMTPDMADVPPMCEMGRIRCNGNHDGTEVCDGKNWQPGTACDAKGGEQCLDGVCKTACDLVGAGNVGCSFYPVNLWSTSTVGELGIVVTNTSPTAVANVKLEDGNGYMEAKTIQPGGVGIYRRPHTQNKLNATELANKGFHLASDSPVAVYQFHPIDAATVFSGSATLLLPEQVMAKNYFVMSYTYNADLMTTPPQGQGFLAVVGLSDNTDVEIYVPVATQGGPGVGALKAKSTTTVRLNRLEVLEIIQINSREDISGATVKSTKPVAVYGGAGGVSIPMSAVGGNHLGVQMFPLETWGKRYLAAKVKQRNSTDKDYFRIVASVDNTTITLSGGSGLPSSVPVLARGQIYEFSTASDFLIEADQPIMAFQYMPAWGNLSGKFSAKDFPDGAPNNCPFAGTANDVQCLGDANITPLIPVEQYRNDYIFYVPETYKYQYVNLLMPIDAKLTLDGAPITDAVEPITADLGRLIVRILTTGNHRITGDKSFGIIGYGYAYATSYSYAGGLNLVKINPIP